MLEKFILNKHHTLKNKIVLAPMTTYSSNEDGTISDQEIEYYKVRSTGVAMVITATTYFQTNGRGFNGQFYAGDDSFIPSLERLAKTIKSEGSKALLQIFHAGRMADPLDGDLVSASAVKPNHRRYGSVENTPLPRALEHNEILDIIEGFYSSTKRAIKAGFDGVEIHGANTYLIQQFFSPNSNIRTDNWGGSLENRIKFPLAIVEAVNRAKSELNKEDFIVGYRFSPEELENPGIRLEDTFFLIDNLIEQKLDYLHISLAEYNSSSTVDKEDSRSILKLIHERIDGRKPLIGVGSIINKGDAKKAIDLGCELVALGKVMVAEPKWVEKSINNEEIVVELDLTQAKSLLIPDNLIQKIIDTPGWFKIKE